MTTSSDHDEVSQRLQELYGTRCLPARAVVHVVSTWCDGDGTRRVIRVGPRAPKSDTDAFILSLARAWADTVVTTGKILRDEPTLGCELQGDLAPALAAWRREVLGKPAPPTLVVLTRGHDLDLAHPAFHGWTDVVVATSPDAARSLRAEPGAPAVVALAQPSLRGTLTWARSEGAGAISIEAGPSTTRAAYDEPDVLDELWMSTLAEPTLHPEARGAPLAIDHVLSARFTCPRAPHRVTEQSGHWSFERWIRRDGPPDAHSS